jgi:hypothetical protein
VRGRERERERERERACRSRLTCSRAQVRDAARERSELECEQELQGIDRSAAAQGGLKKLFVAYGIFGFVRFLDCFYMALIMKRRLVGMIAGHNVYQVAGVKCVHM